MLAPCSRGLGRRRRFQHVAEAGYTRLTMEGITARRYSEQRRAAQNPLPANTSRNSGPVIHLAGKKGSQMSDHASSSPATEIAQNSVFERFARAGYVVSGLLHLIIGYLAIRIALGVDGGTADQSGALAALAAKPGGIVAIWIAVVALVVMGLWRLVETVLGRSTDPKSQGATPEVLDRVKAFALAVVYFAFAYSAFGFARGAGKSTGTQNSAMSARLMQTGAGTIALIAGGVIIVAVGGYHVYKGASRNFLDDLKGKSSDLVRRLGMVGYIAKGLVIAGAGVLVVVAAGRSEPNTATGLDGALKTLGAQPYGAALLIAAGLGIITYGLYSFAMARYTKM